MFTGIIETIGNVRAIHRSQKEAHVIIASDNLNTENILLGDSIATNGVCITVTEISKNGYCADISAETLECTTIGRLAVGDLVNIEQALTLQSRLGGHLVSGHVDGVGTVLAVKPSTQSIEFWFKAPHALARYMAKKGSIAIDGISLTINNIKTDTKTHQFSVCCIPHTQKKTTVAHWKPGYPVNIEVDQIARYLERLTNPNFQNTESSEKSKITETFLAQHGFL